ncbi:hypothetical protein DEO72_LG1g2452 [Vigna unguiculata]|uniref:Uncharacterized protein n=1 Tax=Vigna unguiculata TaxID=3917 RepID=A0A4D6KLA5_VIGUN|nr:hypothetical protein DEO72_LG1g2452 [Vigna unguiculata]
MKNTIPLLSLRTTEVNSARTQSEHPILVHSNVFSGFPALVGVTVLISPPRTVVLTFLAPLKNLTLVSARAFSRLSENSWEPDVFRFSCSKGEGPHLGAKRSLAQARRSRQARTRKTCRTLCWQSCLSESL